MSAAFFVPAGHFAPLVVSDRTHHSAAIIITTATLSFVTLLLVGYRLWARCNPEHDQKSGFSSPGQRRLAVDDYLIIMSTGTYILHCAGLFLACADGLGNSERSIDAERLQRLQKCYFAANILLIAALGFSKLSVAALMVRVNARRSTDPNLRMAATTVMYTVGLWTFAMPIIFGVAKAPWLIIDGEWSTRYLRWQIVGISGCILELCIIALPVLTIWGIQATLRLKAQVVTLFALRLPLIAVIGIQLNAFDQRAFDHDPTLNSTIFICLSELILAYSIWSANFPAAFRRLTRAFDNPFAITGGLIGYRSWPNGLNMSFCHKTAFDTFASRATAPRTTLGEAAEWMERLSEPSSYTWAVHCATSESCAHGCSGERSDDTGIITSRTFVVSNEPLPG